MRFRRKRKPDPIDSEWWAYNEGRNAGLAMAPNGFVDSDIYWLGFVDAFDF